MFHNHLNNIKTRDLQTYKEIKHTIHSILKQISQYSIKDMKEIVDQIENRIVVDSDHFSNKINYYILNSLSYSVYDQQIENLWEKLIFDNEKINLFSQDKAKAKILCILANKTSKIFNIIIYL